MTKIQWTQQTWNPIVGCSRISRGCDLCYASKDSPHRFASKYERDGVIVIRGSAKKPGLTWVPRSPEGKSLGKGAQWTGEIRCLPWVLDKPLGRRKPTTYFVNSLSDIFHEDLVDCEEGRRFIAAIFGVMAACPQHTFQLLTKRPEKAREWFAWLDSVTLGHPRLLFQYLDDLAWERPDLVIPQLQGCTDRRVEWPLPNVWIGTSVEDQRAADERIPELLKVPAAVRFLSVEPLLGPVDLSRWVFDRGAEVSRLRGWLNGDQADASVPSVKISWVIVGGESGPKARPMHPDWARSVRDQCVAAGLPYFFKQWGAFEPVTDETWTHMVGLDGTAIARGKEMPLCFAANPDVAFMRRCGKAEAGRELDGREWNEMPR